MILCEWKQKKTAEFIISMYILYSKNSIGKEIKLHFIICN